jgi:hypothetical protein
MVFLLLIPAALGLGIGCGAFIFVDPHSVATSYALGSGLWLAVFGISISVIFWLEVVALGVLSSSNVPGLARADELYLHHSGLVLASAVVASALVATAAMLLHRIVTRRVTFALFRLYASAVACGVGMLSSFLITWIVAANTQFFPSWITFATTLPILPPLLTFIAYRHPNDFRGARPAQLNPVSLQEYTSMP